MILTASDVPIRAASKTEHPYAAAAGAIPSVKIPVVFAGIEFALNVVRDMLMFAGIENGMFAVSYLLIMHCAIPRVMLQVLPYVMPYVLTVARVVFWSGGIGGVNFGGVPYERGGGIAACACVIR